MSDICHNSDHCSPPSSAGSFEDLLTGKMAEITISLTKSPELRPGERPVALFTSSSQHKANFPEKHMDQKNSWGFFSVGGRVNK